LSQQKDLINKALELKKKEKFSDAIKILEDLLESDSKSESIKNTLIEVLLDYGGYLNDEWVLGYEKAVECFKKIIEMDPNNYRAWYNLGIAYFNLNRIQDALNAYNQALEIKPDYMYCYYNIGLLYEVSEGDLEKALENYEKALTYNKEFVYALKARNMVRRKLDVLKLNKLKQEKDQKK